jgi:hypothetical protein
MLLVPDRREVAAIRPHRERSAHSDLTASAARTQTSPRAQRAIRPHRERSAQSDLTASAARNQTSPRAQRAIRHCHTWLRSVG